MAPARIGTALDLTLPASATLWSARVDGVPVRPLERGGGRISVPLGFDTGRDAVVEVICVQEKAIPKGRSELALDLPRMAVPVQEHRWRLLLPDGARYRYRSGDLRPVVAPSVLTDRVNVGGNESGQQAQYVRTTAILRGRVVDDRGQPLPGVTATLRSSKGKPVAIRVTNAQGFFLLDELPPGDYEIEAALEGFSTVSFRVSSLGVGQNRAIELRLSPAVEDVITVTAEAPLLDERRTGNTETYSLDERTGGGSRRKAAPPPPKAPADHDFDAFQEMAKSLRQGLVGGVKPLPIAIPETGKLLLLSGVLPPERIGVELEVKGDKERRKWF
jgi:hypothetical protein